MPNMSNENTANNKRIAKNTLILYIRMVFLMIVNLYTSRVILQALGIEDYGVYNAVGGFIYMFSMISGSLSVAISRFLTFSLGEGNTDKIKRVFCTSVIIQLVLGLFIIILVETIGVLFLNVKMTIPDDRYLAANWVLQFSLITFLFNLLSVPYNAALIAHERMGAFAYIGIFEGLANLGVAFLVMTSPYDSLITYALLMCVVAVVTRTIYSIYCKRNFDECSFKWNLDKELLKEMFGFAGWNFIGNVSGILRSQGLNLLFNVYNGPIVNAARGLAVQVETAVTKFSGSFYTAVQPQITKSYASNRREEASSLVCKSSRLAFFLLLILCLPILFETDFILNLWLSEVPDHTSTLVQLTLVAALLESFSQPLIQLMLATGKIKKYQIFVGSINILNFPLAWLILYLGCEPEVAQASIILFSLLTLAVRLVMLKGMVNFPSREFLLYSVLRCLLIFAASCIIPFFLCFYLKDGLNRFVLLLITSEITATFIIIYFGINKSEREFFFSKIRTILNK